MKNTIEIPDFRCSETDFLDDAVHTGSDNIVIDICPFFGQYEKACHDIRNKSLRTETDGQTNNTCPGNQTANWKAENAEHDNNDNKNERSEERRVEKKEKARRRRGMYM